MEYLRSEVGVVKEFLNSLVRISKRTYCLMQLNIPFHISHTLNTRDWDSATQDEL